MNRRKRNRIITIIVVCAIIVAAVIWLLLSGKKSDYKTTFVTGTIGRGTISSSVTATGTIEPIVQVEVGTQVSGIVNKLYVDYNSEVTKGQVIAELDKTTLLNDLSSRKSNRDNALTEYEYQEKIYQRTKTLHEKSLVSDTEYELAYYNYAKAKTSYEISLINLASAETNLGYATIYSPIDGVVLSKAVEEGQTVAASFSTPTLFTIANDLTQMQVVADVDEADIGNVAEGQRVEFSVDAYPGTTFEGEVTQVRLEATTTSNVVTYEVVINAPNPDLKLKPGLTANVTIYVIDKQNIICAPTKALKFMPEPPFIGPENKIINCEGENKLWTLKGNVFTAIPVEIGISNSSLTEITGGIEEGTEIVIEATLGLVGSNSGGEDKFATGSSSSSTERSPFMPGPPSSRK
ncbi:MAG: efflux RND transporter periplasmic adaptor subunit [Bacteroidales bacterium]|nr:efflux RND transporter periplasmic adaptor subunit [Bacteroidales bacterium]